MGTLSVIVITMNEERNIRACLESVRWAHEIVVVDDGSTDATLDIAREFTPNVLHHPWEGFGAAKNFAITHCTGEWILWLDADERVTPELQKEMQTALAAALPSVAAFSMPRLANFAGRWIHHCGWYPGRITRVFRRGAGRFTDDKVHERLVVDGAVESLHADLLHYTDPTLAHYLEKSNRYTSLAAEELLSRKKRFNVIKLLANPVWVFIRMYIIRLGFLDGIPGLIVCLFSAHYVFTKYAKLWEISLQTERKEV